MTWKLIDILALIFALLVAIAIVPENSRMNGDGQNEAREENWSNKVMKVDNSHNVVTETGEVSHQVQNT